MITGFNIQDTIRPKLVIRIDPENLLPDSVFRKLDEVPAHFEIADSGKIIKKTSAILKEITIRDTLSATSRNRITDFRYNDSSWFSENLLPFPQSRFPFHLVEKNKSARMHQNLTIIKSLKEGIGLPEKKLHYDWITSIIILSALLWLIVRTTTKSMFTELNRFFLFRGINESSSRDTGSLFYWQSTLLNFVSFLVISLFAYCAAAFYDFIPQVIPPFMFLFISLGIVIVAVTLRHFICTVIGNLSDENELFNEYLMTVYHSYRFSAVAMFLILVLLVYTNILPPQVYFIAGTIVLIVFYLYRVFRLFLIFMKRNVSILYLILYLCALEILPVLILLKYFTGLV